VVTLITHLPALSACYQLKVGDGFRGAKTIFGPFAFFGNVFPPNEFSTKWTIKMVEKEPEKSGPTLKDWKWFIWKDE
jgi:hypothetical protein